MHVYQRECKISEISFYFTTHIYNITIAIIRELVGLILRPRECKIK